MTSTKGRSVFGIKSAYLAVVFILVGGAAIHGRLSNRWGIAVKTTDEIASLSDLPAKFGDWELREETPLNSTALQTLQCIAYSNRVYFNRSTGIAIGVTVLLGPSGPMTVHTPEICLSSRDYTQVGQPERMILRDGDRVQGEMYRAAFRPSLPAAPSLEILYGWNRRDGWRAPESPRFAFAGVPLLYKIQVVSQLWPNVTFGEDGVAARFLKEFIDATGKNFGGSQHGDVKQPGASK